MSKETYCYGDTGLPILIYEYHTKISYCMHWSALKQSFHLSGIDIHVNSAKGRV